MWREFLDVFKLFCSFYRVDSLHSHPLYELKMIGRGIARVCVCVCVFFVRFSSISIAAVTASICVYDKNMIFCLQQLTMAFRKVENAFLYPAQFSFDFLPHMRNRMCMAMIYLMLDLFLLFFPIFCCFCSNFFFLHTSSKFTSLRVNTLSSVSETLFFILFYRARTLLFAHSFRFALH